MLVIVAIVTPQWFCVAGDSACVLQFAFSALAVRYLRCMWSEGVFLLHNRAAKRASSGRSFQDAKVVPAKPGLPATAKTNSRQGL